MRFKVTALKKDAETVTNEIAAIGRVAFDPVRQQNKILMAELAGAVTALAWILGDGEPMSEMANENRLPCFIAPSGPS
jgi:hypothetical protein